MDDYFKRISRALGDASLSERERLDMRLSLQTFMSDHPARLPWHRRFSTSMASRHVSFATRASAFALTLVLVAGVGTSYAAVGSLPGNPLYPIKVGIDEPLERATVASSEPQTQWDITLADRRLQEAEQLAAQNNLTSQNERIVQTQLDAETESFNAAVAAIATSSSAEVAVSNDQSDLEAALSAHVQVLAAIASSSPSVDTQIAPILAAIRTRDEKASGARIAALMQLSASTSTQVRIAASGEKQAAVSALSGIRALAAAFRPDASSSAVIATDASDTQETIQTGDSNLARGKFGQAFAAFQAAALSAQEAQTAAQAQENLSVPLTLPPITTATSTDTSESASSTVDLGNPIDQ